MTKPRAEKITGKCPELVCIEYPDGQRVVESSPEVKRALLRTQFGLSNAGEDDKRIERAKVLLELAELAAGQKVDSERLLEQPMTCFGKPIGEILSVTPIKQDQAGKEVLVDPSLLVSVPKERQQALAKYSADVPAEWARLNDWLTNKTGAVSERTLFRYQQVVRDFLAHMGSRAQASIASVSPPEIVAFRNKLREEGRSVATCNAIRGMLSVPFEGAHKLGFSPINPVAAVEPLKDRSTKSGREPFTAQEAAKLVQSAQGDWRGAVLLAATTGLRLGDVANLYWESVDMDNNLLRIETKKTGRVVVLPMHPDFAEWLSGRTRGIGKAPVFPNLAGQAVAGGGGLSVQFRNIVEEAGVTGKVISRTGKGRSMNSKTFHGLRHSFISQLANAGVAPEIRQKLAGHASLAAHQIYTHHEIETLRGAIAKLPSFKAQ